MCFDDIFFVCIISKIKVDNIFWGEYFEFFSFLFFYSIIVYIYKDVEKKKKKDKNNYVGLVNIFIVSVIGC